MLEDAGGGANTPAVTDSSSGAAAIVGNGGAIAAAPPTAATPRVPQYAGAAYNHCTLCGYRTPPGVTEAKYCPWCGPEMAHVPPGQRCLSCQEQVIFADAKFCAWCGKPLE
jgi:hypothetical protein